MKDELRFLGLTPLFAAAGAVSTAIVWQVFALTLLDLVPDRLAVLCCLTTGLAGPLVFWAGLWLATGNRPSQTGRAIRRAASVGLGLVLAAELGFYIPLGFFAIAFH